MVEGGGVLSEGPEALPLPQVLTALKKEPLQQQEISCRNMADKGCAGRCQLTACFTMKELETECQRPCGRNGFISLLCKVCVQRWEGNCLNSTSQVVKWSVEKEVTGNTNRTREKILEFLTQGP